MQIFINNKFYPEKAATIPAKDLSLLRGYGVFDFLKTYSGKPFQLQRHMRNFLISARMLKLKNIPKQSEIEQAVLKTIQRNREMDNMELRLILTGGVGKSSTETGNAHFIIIPNKITTYPQSYYEKGIVLKIEIVERPYPTIKHLAYMQNVFFLNNAKRQGAQEVLFISEKKEICECANSNFFFVKNGALYTAPPDRVYPGVTRELVLKIAKQNHIPVYEKPIFLKDLKKADEVFITSTTKEIMPIKEILDIWKFKNPFKISSFLHHKFQALL